jgi:uncharacterized membrane protein YjjP (DUF1212 family)
MSFDLLDNYSLDNQPNFPERSLPIGFMLRLAKALHTYGMTAYELEKNMKKVGEKLGFGLQCFAQPTGIIMSFSHPREPEPKTYLFRVEPGDINLERQIQVDTVAEQVLNEEITVEEGARILKEISLSPPNYQGLTTIAGFGMVSGAVALVFGGGLAEVIVAFIIGLCTGMLSNVVLRYEHANFLFPSLAALGSALIATLVAHLGYLGSVYIATLAGVIVLVPGLMLTTAISELAMQNMVSGTARLMTAITIFLQIGFGLAIGNYVGTVLFPPAEVIQQFMFPAWSRWIAIMIASSGLFILFQSRKQDYPWVILAGLIAYTSTLVGSIYLGAIMGAFVGALTTGIVANLFERLAKVTRSVMLMPGIILLVPGSVGFQSLSMLVQNNILEGIDTAVKMTFVAVALVSGLLMSSLILSPQPIQPSDD